MRLTHARVQNYRCVRDTGWFDIEQAKTILVGPNEAGKTAVLEALQQINRPAGVKGFDPLRDYPRKLYNAEIQVRKRDPGEIPVSSARFALDPEDLAELHDDFSDAVYGCTRSINNELTHWLEGGPAVVVFSEELRNDLTCLAIHVDIRARTANDQEDDGPGLSAGLKDIIAGWEVGTTRIADDCANELRGWLDSVIEFVGENDATQVQHHARLLGYTRIPEELEAALTKLKGRLPVFIFFNDYFRVRPNLHLRHFAARIERGSLDDGRYDYGNVCLLKLLGFDAGGTRGPRRRS